MSNAQAAEQTPEGGATIVQRWECFVMSAFCAVAALMGSVALGSSFSLSESIEALNTWVPATTTLGGVVGFWWFLNKGNQVALCPAEANRRREER